LRLAQRAGFEEVAQFLIARGADPKMRPNSCSKQVDTLFCLPAGAPGAAVIVIHCGKVLYKQGYGLADRERKTRNRPDTPFILCSVSKQFTAMAIMTLVERGKLGYEDPLIKFFPDFPPYAKEITIRHLLYHTSGIADYLNDGLVEDATDFTDQQVMDLLKRQKGLKFPPGQSWSYSNSGYNLLARIVERVSGQPFREFMQEQIFRPLGMKHTYVCDEPRPRIAGRARGYTPVGDDFRLNDYRLFTTGDGGIYSTVEDMFRWDQCLYTERLIRAATLKEAFTSGRLRDGTEFGYGFGWRVGEFRGLRTISHAGGSFGFGTNILRIPSQRFTVVVLANNWGISAEKFCERIAEIYLWQRMVPRSGGG
jgi:CubicO group peptidase (beta-lactamase class C family)